MSGTVSYRVPPATTYTELTGTATLPLGVLLDTTDGKVRVTSQVDGAPQAATFHGGKFSVTQTSTGMTEMALAGALDCSASERAGISAAREEEKEEAPALGQGQRRLVPHARQRQRRDGPRNRMADRGHLRGHDRLRARGRGVGVAPARRPLEARPRRPATVLASPGMIRLAKVAGALAALVALVAALTPALERAELATIDARFGIRGTQPVSGVAVVGIDERSFSELDAKWPFRRTLHAQMVDRLREAGVRQIVYDVQFTEPSEDPDEDLALYEAVGRAKRVILATGEVDDQGGTRVLGGDEGLAEAGARAAASTFPTDPGGAIRRYAREDTHLRTIPALVGERFGRR